MSKFSGKFESAKQEWETPKELFEPLNDEFAFTLDVCADESNKKVERYFSEEDDALSKKWRGVCWMNPPYRQCGKWVKKAWEEAQTGTTVVALIPARTNTVWWHEYVMKAKEVRLIKGRPKFGGAEHGLPQPLAVVVWKPQTQETEFSTLEVV